MDTGETARVHERGYHPRWHPFYRRAARFSVHPDEELGPQLRALGIGPRDVRHVVLTHLHTDHAGGLVHVTGSRVWVARGEFERASGMAGRVRAICRTAGRSGGSRNSSASTDGRSARSKKRCR